MDGAAAVAVPRRKTGYHAPLVRQGSRLRLARPEERNARRLEHPQTAWDILHGIIQAYRRGDIPVARAYLDRHAAQHTRKMLDLLDVWAARMDDPDLRREAETLRFGLRPIAGKCYGNLRRSRAGLREWRGASPIARQR